jgi:putative CocE/NonD family hydrolase
VIEWIAAQPWCTGAVGMIGKSWGGFNVLQIAARRPRALRAVVSVCASDDRYADDAHFMGGCLLNENLTWGTVLLAVSALPPDPRLVGERWRDTWIERLDHALPFSERWLRHQRRDAYWRRGSVCEEPGAIECPLYAVGGWADAYTNAIPRLVADRSGPRKGLVGPWGHLYPHAGVPGPAIGFLQEMLRWWDCWLRGIDTGVLDEPSYRVWMGDRWVAEASWPTPRITPRRWTLGLGRLEETAGAETRLDTLSPQSVGIGGGDWCVFGDEGDMPTEQRDDDAASLAFDSELLGERLEILGAPVAVLELAVDRPQAFVAVRLNEVREDGSSTRVTYGVLNLTHRDGHEDPEPVEPGRRYRVRVALNQIAHAFPRGSRIRLAISTAYWPVVWPSAEPVTLSVFTGASMLELPVRPPSPDDERLAAFGEPEGAAPPEYTTLREWTVERTVEREAEGEVTHAIVSGGAGRFDAIGLALDQSSVRRYRIRDNDPLSARAEVVQRLGLRRGTWEVAVESRAWLAATRDVFRLRMRLDAFEGSELVRSRSWDADVARDAV